MRNLTYRYGYLTGGWLLYFEKKTTFAPCNGSDFPRRGNR
jgi:hypothetical protein